MLNRVSFALIAAFWLTMTVLLVRTEFGAHRLSGSPVPVSSVTEKILTAPDSSSLQILYRGTNVGFCRWTASVGQDVSETFNAWDGAVPEGMIAQPTSYTLDLDGHLNLAEFGLRLGYNFTLKLDAERAWEEFDLRLKLRPDIYEIHALAEKQTVEVRVETEERQFHRVLHFSDLQNPHQLLREAGGPFLPGLLASFGLPTSTNALTRLSLGLDWQAYQDRLKVGRNPMRAYRLEARLLDRYQATVYVSPVGEILRVELPGGLVMLHETLHSLPPPP